FFKVFLAGCIEYEYRKESETKIDLQNWCTENILMNFSTKYSGITILKDTFLESFSPSFLDLKDLAINLRTILFGVIGIELQTSDDRESNYKHII
ncbi:Bgt-50821, partial [Blumeria graminis f. sp. tritici]